MHYYQRMSSQRQLETHLLPVELGKAFPELHERGLHAGVVGQS